MGGRRRRRRSSGGVCSSGVCSSGVCGGCSSLGQTVKRSSSSSNLGQRGYRAGNQRCVGASRARGPAEPERGPRGERGLTRARRAAGRRRQEGATRKAVGPRAGHRARRVRRRRSGGRRSGGFGECLFGCGCARCRCFRARRELYALITCEPHCERWVTGGWGDLPSDCSSDTRTSETLLREVCTAAAGTAGSGCAERQVQYLVRSPVVGHTK